jgi:hypothetical protein
MLFGYACLSTDDHNLDLQRAALIAAGCTKIFENRITGTARSRHAPMVIIDRGCSH